MGADSAGHGSLPELIKEWPLPSMLPGLPEARGGKGRCEVMGESCVAF